MSMGITFKILLKREHTAHILIIMDIMHLILYNIFMNSKQWKGIVWKKEKDSLTSLKPYCLPYCSVLPYILKMRSGRGYIPLYSYLRCTWRLALEEV